MASSQRGVMQQPAQPVAAPNAVQTRIAEGTNPVSLVLVGGLVLMGVNFFLPATGPGQLSVLDLGLQGAMLLLLILIASVSAEGATFAVIFVAALWLGFLYTHRSFFAGLDQLAGGGSSSSSSSGSPTK